MSTALNVKRTYTTKDIVHMVITLLLMFGVGFLPPFATLTPMGMKILGVFLGIVYGYTTWDTIIVSLFAFVAFGITGFNGGFNDAVATMLGNSTVYQSLVLFFTSGSIVYYGFGKWFTRWSLSKKIFHGKPLFYTWCFLFIFMWAGLLVGQTSMILLLCPIWNDIAESCGYNNDKDNFRYFGFGGILLALVSGGGMITYKGWTLGLANQWAELVGAQINLGFQFGVNFILSTLIVTVYVLVGSKVFKIDFSKMKAFDVNKMDEDSKVLRPRVKRILVFYFISILLAILNSIPMVSKLPGFSFIGNTMTISGVYTILAAVLMFLPSGEHDGEPCIPFSKIKHALVNWPVIMMCAVTIPVASALTNEATGVLPWLTGIFSPLFEGRSPILLIVFTIVCMQFLTNIGSNIAFGSAMIPIVGPFAVASGLNLTVMGTAIIYCANLGLVLPGASAPAALFHSRDEIPDAGRRTKVMLFAALCVVVCGILVYGPVAMFM